MDRISNLSEEDQNIKKYKDTAQAQINYLIEFMNTHASDDSLFQYFVKANFEEDELNEHMWVFVTEYKDNYFIGKLANDPTTIKKLKHSDDVRIKMVDVEDWILNDYLTKTKVGGFSQEYLREKGQ